jgi:hypothetical protein
VKHFSYGQLVHNLVLTRFLIAAHAWAARQDDFKLNQTRICYDLAREAATVEVIQESLSAGKQKKKEKHTVIPDAWLQFEKLKNGEHEYWFPILLEIDRGMEYQKKFKSHLRSRIEFIKKEGTYSKMFSTEAVIVAYV